MSPMPHLRFPGDQQLALAQSLPWLVYAVGALVGRLAVSGRILRHRAWMAVSSISAMTLLFALASFLLTATRLPTLILQPATATLVQMGPFALSFRLDLIGSMMLLLVSFLGWVIVRYSRSYMAGDTREMYYVSRLMQTIASVSLLIVTNNLILFLVAWVLTSISLHGLLVLYPNRQAAVIVAHKKFLASRIADASLLVSVLLLGNQAGSFEISRVIEYSSTLQYTSRAMHVAAFLLVISAAIKCAQLPMHGWLIQVMEAPTPVSALLHAGVVNLGGFMLIRLAPVIDDTPSAKLLLIVVGCSTAVVASLVMTTRVSIKVHLAWSTCAQMGFMLLECGLGLYGLAFLHLLAHSIYKAHAFLTSGETVQRAQQQRMAPSAQQPNASLLLGATFAGLLTAGTAARLLLAHGSLAPTTLLCALIAGMAASTLLTAALSTRRIYVGMLSLAAALGVCLLYFSYERAFRMALPELHISPGLHPLPIFLTASVFTLLYLLQASIVLGPQSRLTSRLYPWLYAGLYLDELFTRVTFRIWPAKDVRAS